MRKIILSFFLLFSVSVISFAYQPTPKGKEVKSLTVVVTKEKAESLQKTFEDLIDTFIEGAFSKYGAENILDIKMSMHLTGMVITFIYQE